MTIPVLTFFNNKGGVGKTSLVYHLAWILSQTGHRVLTCDLDPQANLSAAFLDEDELEALWKEDNGSQGKTVFKCVNPLLKVGDLLPPVLQEITSTLKLIPGDMRLSGFEDKLSREWPEALGKDPYRPFRILTSFWTVMQKGAEDLDATVILADVGPNLGAINRSALIATDYVIVPLGADLFSLQGLRNLGPTLKSWCGEWQERQEKWKPPEFELPEGRMKPLGYIVQQHSVRLSRPVKAYDKWVNRMPKEYADNLLNRKSGPFPASPQEDENCLATVKHYRSLIPMGQESRKPIFDLTAADGAIGSHATATQDARRDFQALAKLITDRAGLIPTLPGTPAPLSS
ncbi:MAG: AAA family ATPase [Nitrospira sp.]|nr:AAA family ATPase [Nitrospira sp.]